MTTADIVVDPATPADEIELSMWLAQAIADGNATLSENGTVILSPEFVRQMQEETA